MRTLSYSQISTYQKCPLLYKLQYIDGLKPKEKPYFSFGSTVHLAAEYFYKVKVPVPPSLESLLAFYEANWISEGYTSKEEEEKQRVYGREILTTFWRANAPLFRLPVATEFHFNTNIEGIKLQGYIDRVDKLGSGKLSVVDYKTSREFFTRDHLERDLQLTLYQIAAEQTWFLPVGRLTLYHLRSNTPCSCEARGKLQLDEARREVVTVAESIEKSLFEPAENNYCPCDFPEYCPYHKHKYAPLEVTTSETATPAGVAVPEVIERYVSIKFRIKELELELEEIKAQLLDIFESQNVKRLYTPKYQLTYRQMERLGFSEDEVKALLEPLGLWTRVLGFNEAMVKQFMEGSEIIAPIRRELEKLRKIKSSYPQFWVRKLGEEE